MATNAQINANRKNAKKSTGPRTPQGKERSSKNALKHGLLAQDSVIPGEDPADFDRHLTLYEDTYNPANCVERELVLQIADSAWRIRRLSRIEATVMTAGIERTRVHQETFRPERTREGHEGKLQLLGASMLDRTKLLNNLARYDGHLNRRFHRSVELMIKIRREESKTPRRGKQSNQPRPRRGRKSTLRRRTGLGRSHRRLRPAGRLRPGQSGTTHSNRRPPRPRIRVEER